MVSLDVLIDPGFGIAGRARSRRTLRDGSVTYCSSPGSLEPLR